MKRKRKRKNKLQETLDECNTNGIIKIMGNYSDGEEVDIFMFLGVNVNVTKDGGGHSRHQEENSDGWCILQEAAKRSKSFF